MTVVDSGILSKVPGGVTAAGQEAFPPASRNGPQEMRVVVDADWLGPVEITYRVHEHKHNKTAYWFWLAVHARQICDGVPLPPAENPG